MGPIESSGERQLPPKVTTITTNKGHFNGPSNTRSRQGPGSWSPVCVQPRSVSLSSDHHPRAADRPVLWTSQAAQEILVGQPHVQI